MLVGKLLGLLAESSEWLLVGEGALRVLESGAGLLHAVTCSQQRGGNQNLKNEIRKNYLVENFIIFSKQNCLSQPWFHDSGMHDSDFL